jgi:general L-amino acid transport system permease protein
MAEALSAKDPNHTQRDQSGWSIFSLIYNEKARGLLFQFLLLCLIAYVGYHFFQNAMQNLRSQNIASGFGFLKNSAGFDITQKLIPYNESSTYMGVFFVGLLNTLLVAGIGVVFATIIGLIVGILRLSNNWVLRLVAGAYVEVTRNLPLLFQLMFWYVAVLSALPASRASYNLFDAFFLNIRGLYVPYIWFVDGIGITFAVFTLALIASIVFCVWAHRHQISSGKFIPAVRLSLLGMAVAVFLSLAATGFPIAYELPTLKGFNFIGGLRLIPEFVALVLALSTYTAGFIAEIVRAGILAISHGQTEASYSLGMRPGHTLRLIVIPQAMRVIIPPLTSQYLNLTKNSSLAVAIGYPDLVAVFSGTALSQTGQAIEIIGITMLTYLAISLIISFFMNVYNKRVALVER